MSVIWNSLAILTVCFSLAIVGCGSSEGTSQAEPAPNLEAEADALDEAPSTPIEQ
ncbi:secreted protein [Rhodopirellula maiorica SM1]|uniref:Secreted protein n=1 Tax=Rhodopirellula maiorica SM1 TaxID=1265738 RepID=M5S3Z0_9BACT|nr:secreted protein [Rhodopirellula maiorica SM1]